MKVRELMNADIVTLRSETELTEIYAVMMQYKQSDFPVVNGDYQLVGMLHEENILKPLFEQFRKKGGDVPNYSDFTSLMQNSEFSGICAVQIMSPDETGVPLDLDIVRAGAIMAARKVRHLAVIADERVVGMISDSAIFLQLMRLASDPAVVSKETMKARAVLGTLKIEDVEKSGRPAGERRKFERLDATMKVAYKRADAEGKTLQVASHFCTCLNVSLGGMLLEVDENLPLKHLVVMAFEIPGSGVPIKRLARVSRITPAAMQGCYKAGVMFLALSVQETAAMQQLLKTLRPGS